MRARYPDRRGTVERNGARIHYELYENSGPTVLLVQTWNIIHSRHWKMQIAYLARHFRVVTYDPVGNGLSDRPLVPERYGADEYVADALAVLDATGTSKCVAVGFSQGGGISACLAALHPERIEGILLIAPGHPWMVSAPAVRRGSASFHEHVENPRGWAKNNLGYWKRDWKGFVEFFFGEVCSDPHSTKLWDDAVGWALETDGEVIGQAYLRGSAYDRDWLEEKFRAINCPALIVHATADRLIPRESSEILAELIGAELTVLEESGHFPHGRYPVRINHLIRDFVERACRIQPPRPNWHAALRRPRRVLYVSSPIGLGHARRDVAIADELRRIHEDIQIDWLAQDPVTRVLAARGETIHPASRLLANESAHIEAESGEHELAVFQALRDMDEILLANFMLFDEVVEAGQYDLVIGDEAWEVDFHLHENPLLKKTAFAWLTDFVGYLPMPGRGLREAEVVADYNAEMIEQIARYPRIRDRAIFIGNPDDIVEGTFGPGLPEIRKWTGEHYRFAGYVAGFDPGELGSRAELRAELGYRDDEQVCIVAVGGSGVGGHLLRKVIQAWPACKRANAGLRMIIVTGPRIDPASLPRLDGLEYHSYVDRLYRNLAACDLAVVQGGLTTTMELTTSKVPFIYVPLRNHFEQNFHVTARLNRYRAGRRLSYDEIDPETLANAITEELGKTVDYRDVETDGANRAARLIAELI